MVCVRFFRRVALGVGEGFKGIASFALADLGEMEVTHDFLEGAVAEVGGDLTDRGSAFEHVGAITVAQGVRSEQFVLFG